MRRRRYHWIGRNIDPPPSGEDDVTGNDAQRSFLAAIPLDNIFGADRKLARQTALSATHRQTHLPLRRTTRSNACGFRQVPEFL